MSESESHHRAPNVPADAAGMASLRHDYHGPSLEEEALAAEPIGQFHSWFDEAVRAATVEPNSMVLATVDAQGRPRQRTVLLKGFDADGFVFFTNYESAKGEQIAGNPQVSLLFGWLSWHRQVIVTGRAVRVGRDETLHYFTQRPHGAQLAAWASRQSQVVADRAELEAAYVAAEHRFGDDVPPPPHWGGFRVVPSEVEFWQGRANRLHDRLRYRRGPAGGWVVERLAP